MVSFGLVGNARGRAGLLAGLTALLALVAAPPQAGATYRFSLTWGQAGTADGDLKTIEGLGLNEFGYITVSDSARGDVQSFDVAGTFHNKFDGSTHTGSKFQHVAGLAAVPFGPNEGDVYVADEGGNRIEQFDPDGHFIRQWGTEGTGNHQFQSPRDVAVAPFSPFNVYVADSLNQRVEEYSSSGTFIRKFAINTGSALRTPLGIAVGVGGTVYVAESSTDEIREYSAATGHFIRSFTPFFPDAASVGPRDVAVDGFSRVYVVDENQRVGKFTPNGTYITTIGHSGFGQHNLKGPVSVAVDPLNEGVPEVVYIAESVTDSVVGPTGRVEVFDPIRPVVTLTSGPHGGGFTRDATPTFKFASSQPGSSFKCSLDPSGPPTYTGCPSPFTPAHLDDGNHFFNVEATDRDGLVGDPLTVAFVVDTVAPDTQITAAPVTPTSDTTPTFQFASADAGAHFKCKVDQGPFADCTSPKTTAALADGTHTFSVEAIDAAGNVDASPAVFTFSVVTTPPETSIDGPALTKDATPEFDLSSDVLGATFECELDGAGFAACASPFTVAPKLNDGPHVLSARASAAGLTDPSPAVRMFVVDTKDPTTKITGDPGKRTSDRTPKFKFKSRSDDDAGFECKVDRGHYKSCHSPKTLGKLARGKKHTFKVRAIDAAGNKDPSPSKWKFTVKR